MDQLFPKTPPHVHEKDLGGVGVLDLCRASLGLETCKGRRPRKVVKPCFSLPRSLPQRAKRPKPLGRRGSRKPCLHRAQVKTHCCWAKVRKKPLLLEGTGFNPEPQDFIPIPLKACKCKRGRKLPLQDQPQIQVRVWLPQKGGTRMLRRDSFPSLGTKDLLKTEAELEQRTLTSL